MTIEAVLFDLDGTLVDSNDQHVLAWEEAFRGEGHEVDRQAIHDQIGKGADMLVPALLPGIPESVQDTLADARSRIFADRYRDAVKCFPGAHDLLKRVHATGRKVVLASSASASEVDRYLGLLDAEGFVFTTTSADEVERTKPAPDIFATALTKLSPLRSDEVVVVGDTPYDVEAAAKCGLATVALRSGGFDDEALTTAGALCIYDDVAALLADFEHSPLNG